MCIVIDVNVLPNVFQSTNADHQEFKYIKDWIINGKGKLVYGGTDFINEIPVKFRRIINQLKIANKVVLANGKDVDNYTKEVKKIIQHRDFDDPHLVALLKITGCKLIASNDIRAYPYFRHQVFFGVSRNRPKIYSGSGNRNLLVDNNIADICKPCHKTTNVQRKVIGSI